MIPLMLAANSEAEAPFVTRLRSTSGAVPSDADSVLFEQDRSGVTYVGRHGLLTIDGATAGELEGDIVLAQPGRDRVERLLRAASPHNTLLVTERCDQLCVMCSQPPKKSHVDRFALLEQACLLAEPDTLIGVSGGEPTLFKNQLLSMIESVLGRRPDLQFRVLTNGQHFEESDGDRLAMPVYRRVSWGIPLYAASAQVHNEIVGKARAFERLHQSFATLLGAGARVELRTVLLRSNLDHLGLLERFVAHQLRFVEAWSIMQLEHIGFAKGRWTELYVEHSSCFAAIADALDHALLYGVRAQLFNFPRCSVPPAYRHLAPASISDWKRKYAPACGLCSERSTCCGFFEWHPEELAAQTARPL